MADENEPNVVKGGQASVLDQAAAALNKAAKEAVVSKLKDVLKRKQEALRTVALADAEAQQIIDDFNKGLL